jgi:hypothetical protein
MFPNPLRRLDAADRYRRHLESFESEHRSDPVFNSAGSYSNSTPLGMDTLILRECKRGSFSIAREWTDWADPPMYDPLSFQPQRLDADSYSSWSRSWRS